MVVRSQFFCIFFRQQIVFDVFRLYGLFKVDFRYIFFIFKQDDVFEYEDDDLLVLGSDFLFFYIKYSLLDGCFIGMVFKFLDMNYIQV